MAALAATIAINANRQTIQRSAVAATTITHTIDLHTNTNLNLNLFQRPLRIKHSEYLLTNGRLDTDKYVRKRTRTAGRQFADSRSYEFRFHLKKWVLPGVREKPVAVVFSLTNFAERSTSLVQMLCRQNC